MIRPLLFIFLGLTVFLILIHIRKIDYYENLSKEITEDIYSGKTTISGHLSKYEQDDYVFNLSFNHIQSDILVNDISVEMVMVNEHNGTSLDLIKILPYSGMHPWDIPKYKSFSEIPTNLLKLNTESNPYFAYDFIFEQNAKIETNDLLVRINLNISEDGNAKQISKELAIQKISKIELKPLDAHSDISFLLIPVTGVLTIIFALIWIINRKQKKTNA